MINLSDILKSEMSPFLMGAIISRIKFNSENNYFYVYSSFKCSKYSGPIQKKLVLNIINKYNKLSKINNWFIEKISENNVEIIFEIFNDINITEDELYKKTYSNIINSPWVMDNNMNEEKRMFIIGFMETRGSIDTTRKYISQDYFYKNRIELKKGLILYDIIGIPLEFLNINWRELQPDYVSGKSKRNTQLRIKLEYYAKEIGFVNEYKASIIKNVYAWKWIENNGIIKFETILPNSNLNLKFIEYLNFFSNNIYCKKITPELIQKYRNELGFDKNNKNCCRSPSIVKIFDEISEDKCAICKKEKTFTKRSNGKQYFEIHHVISLHNNRELDNIANLVKLCPECHASLKKNRSTVENQINSIKILLTDYPEIFEFTSSYLNIDDIFELSKKIQSLLG